MEGGGQGVLSSWSCAGIFFGEKVLKVQGLSLIRSYAGWYSVHAYFTQLYINPRLYYV